MVQELNQLMVSNLPFHKILTGHPNKMHQDTRVEQEIHHAVPVVEVLEQELGKTVLLVVGNQVDREHLMILMEPIGIGVLVVDLMDIVVGMLVLVDMVVVEEVQVKLELVQVLVVE